MLVAAVQSSDRVNGDYTLKRDPGTDFVLRSPDAHYNLVERIGVDSLIMDQVTKSGTHKRVMVIVRQRCDWRTINEYVIMMIAQESGLVPMPLWLSPPTLANPVWSGCPDTLRFMVIELVKRPTLSDISKLRPLSITDALIVGIKIFKLVDGLHKLGISHGDIRAESILVLGDNPVTNFLTFAPDFGSASFHALGLDRGVRRRELRTARFTMIRLGQDLYNVDLGKFGLNGYPVATRKRAMSTYATFKKHHRSWPVSRVEQTLLEIVELLRASSH